MTIDRLREILKYNPDTGILTWINAVANGSIPKGTEAGYVNNEGYRQLWIGSYMRLSHRVAWAIFYGEWPKGEIDHVNGIKDDNRIQNLRVVSHRKNQQNRIEHRSGNLVGARKNSRSRKNPWQSQIRINGKRIHLGCFPTELDAHKAYIEKVEELKEAP